MIEKRKKEKQTLLIYCNKCNTELFKNGILIKNDCGIAEYKCPNCGNTSFWDFSFRTPYLRTCGDCMHLKIDKVGDTWCKYENERKCNPCTQVMFDTTHRCEYCDDGKPLIIGRTNDQGIAIQYPNILDAYGYDVHGSSSNGLCIRIKYCPMCGKKLKGNK